MKNVIKPNNKRLVYDWLFLVYSRVFGKIGFHISHMKELCDWFTTIIIFNLWLLIGSPTLLNVLFFFLWPWNKQTKKWTNWLLTHDPEDPNIYIYIIYYVGVLYSIILQDRAGNSKVVLFFVWKEGTPPSHFLCHLICSHILPLIFHDFHP